MVRGLSDHHTSPPHRAQHGTGLSVRKLRSALGFVTGTHSLMLSEAERNNDLLKQHSQSRVSPDRDMYYRPSISLLPYLPGCEAELCKQKCHL